jgi:hypothetical protein
MADKKISALTGATTPLTGAEVLPVVQGGTTVKVSVNNLTLGRAVEANSLTLNADGLTILASEAYSYLYSSGGIGFNARVRFRAVNSGGGSGYGGSFELESRTSGNVWNTGALSVTDSGNLSTTGNIVLGTAAKGIDFSANGGDVLTQYDEGTWTPAIAFATNGDLAVTYSTQSGTYTRVGRQVTVSFVLVTSSFTHTTASGALRITGTPFNAGSTFQYTSVAGLVQGVTKANYTTFGFYANAGSTDLTSAASGSGQNFDNITAANMPTGGSVILACTLTYFV